MSADTTQPMTRAAALNLALADSLVDDPSVLVFGEDVGALGGVFRVTDGSPLMVSSTIRFMRKSPMPV